MKTSSDIERIAAEILPRSEELLRELLPAGRRIGREWVVGSLKNEPGDSCKTNIDTGRGSDFATGETWGDLVGLYAKIHGVSQTQAARAVSGAATGPRKTNGFLHVEDKSDEIHTERPPHSEFTVSLFRHTRYGTPVAFWVYRDTDGPMFVVARYDSEHDRKQIVPWIWTGLQWTAKAPDRPRPLYGLDRLASLTGPVLLVEGEKTADAAQRYWPGRPCITWMGGTGGVNAADWAPLSRRDVTLWPDADDAGRIAMEKIGQTLCEIGCKVKLIDTFKWPDGWDLADAEEERRTATELVEYARTNAREIKFPPIGSLPQAARETVQRANAADPAIQAAIAGAPPKIVITDTDIANCKRLIFQHGENVRYTTESGWLVWDGQRWHPDPESVALVALAKQTALSLFDDVRFANARDESYRHAKKSQSKTAIVAMEYLSRSEPGVLIRFSELDADPYLLNCRNGTVDLHTGELRSHSRSDFLTKLTDVVYDASADCPQWKRFIDRIFASSSELIEYMQRVAGYSLTGQTSEQVLHFLYGTGANGKSVFCDTLGTVLGDYSIVAQPDMVMAKRSGGIPNDIASLRGVRAVFMNETSQGSRFDEAKLKDLTGGDKLSARFLHQEFFTFKPSHKLMIRGNHKPTIAGTDEGIWRRLRLVPFTVSIPTTEQDRDLPAKLASELPGILRWAIEGCLQWQREGLAAPAVVTAAGNEYRADSDVLQHFIDEHCQVRGNAEVRSQVFYKQYRDYCVDANERCMSAKDLPLEMARRGFSRRRDKAGQCYLGLEIAELPALPNSWHDRSDSRDR